MTPAETNLRAYAKVLVWVAATVASAVIGIFMKSLWEAPRPITELISVDIASPLSEADVLIPAVLSEQMKAHIYSPEIGPKSNMTEIKETKSLLARTDQIYADLSLKIDVLINLLKTRTGDMDGRRQEFLLKWAEGDESERLTNVVRGVVTFPESTLPKKYMTHPPGAKQLTVPLGKNMLVDLSEIDEERLASGEANVRGPMNVYEVVKRRARSTNVVRRL